MSATVPRKRRGECKQAGPSKRLTFGDSGTRPASTDHWMCTDAETVRGFVTERQRLIICLAKVERERDKYKKLAETFLVLQRKAVAEAQKAVAEADFTNTYTEAEEAVAEA